MVKQRRKHLRNISCSEIKDCPTPGTKNVAVLQKVNGDIQAWCHKCKKYLPSDSLSEEPHKPSTAEVVAMMPKYRKDADKPVFVSEGIPERNIKQTTLDKFNVKVTDKGEHWYPYGEDTYKIRGVNKNFRWSGGGDKSPLFGMDAYPAGSAKYITVCEGEADALAAAQMLDSSGLSRSPVVSVPNGAGSALASCKEAFEYLNSFSQGIVFAFDNDKPGQDAVLECCDLFPHKSKVMRMRKPYKDACDYLKDNQVKSFNSDWWSSQAFVPDGVVKGSDLKSLVMEPLEKSIALYPFPGINDMTGGIRNEMCVITAGTGLGKSQFLREIVYKLLKTTEESIGCLFLEESVKTSGLSIMSLDSHKRLHLNEVEATDEEKKLAFDATLGTGRLFFYDSFGSTSIDNIINRIRFMVHGMGCKFIFLDHISIVVSDQSHTDERKALDEICTRLRMLVEEMNISLFAVSHLRRPSGIGHEEAAATKVSDLRGSGAIAQLADTILGLERNSQAKDLNERHTTKVRVLKNRYSGLTGLCSSLYYDRNTGRMNEVFEEDLEEPK